MTTNGCREMVALAAKKSSLVTLHLNDGRSVARQLATSMQFMKDDVLLVADSVDNRTRMIDIGAITEIEIVK